MDKQLVVAIGWDILTSNPKSFNEWESAVLAAPLPSIVLLPSAFHEQLRLVYQIRVADALLEKLSTTIRIELIDSLLPGGLSTTEALAQLKIYFPKMCHFAQQTMFWEYALLERSTISEGRARVQEHTQFRDMLVSVNTKLQSLVDFGMTLHSLQSSSQFTESHPTQGKTVAAAVSW